jgi:hypothetical protein
LREKLRLAVLTLCPPFRPASAANLGFYEKLRFSFGTLSPPFRAITRCFSRSIEAKPRVEVEDFLGISIASAIVSLKPLSLPRPSLDMAEVSRRSATDSRSSEGSILTRLGLRPSLMSLIYLDAPPDFLASTIIRAMDAFVRRCNCLTDRTKAIARSVLQNVDMHVISVCLIGPGPSTVVNQPHAATPIASTVARKCSSPLGAIASVLPFDSSKLPTSMARPDACALILPSSARLRLRHSYPENERSDEIA